MNKQRLKKVWYGALVVVLLTACAAAASTTNTTSTTNPVTVSNDSGTTAVTSTTTTESEPITDAGAASVVAVAAENSATHDKAEDYEWDSSVETQITLSGDAIDVVGAGVQVDGRIATITSAGTYSLSGALTDGQIIVDTEDEATVHLILNGVNLSSTTSAPLYIANAAEVVIMLAEGSENFVLDATNYVFADPEEDEPNAALFSKADLTIFGEGTLTVTGNYNDGIASKDGLIIASGTILVTAVDDGIRGKDYLLVKDGSLTVNVGGDGLKSDNEEDATMGYIAIETGSFNITAGGDTIQAKTDVIIADGQFTITAGGGSSSFVDESSSAKGLKAGVNLNIDGGTFILDTADDAVHSNGSIVINNGTFTVATGDDGFHADATLEINAGTINITDSYEGIESAIITINGGEIHLVASDDGLNVASGNDGSGTGNRFGGGGRPGQDTFAASSDYYLHINGGTIVIDAAGDGIDVNGFVEMTDGVVLVNGPTEQMNGALDYDGSFSISGGFFVAVGSAGMAQAPGEASSQNSLLVNLGGTLPAGSLLHIQTSSGEDVLTFASSKQIQSIAFSSPQLVTGETYELYYDGSTTGMASDGLYQDGIYSEGTLFTSVTLTGTVTRVGNFR